MLPDEQLPAQLVERVLALRRAPERLEAMRRAACQMARPGAAQLVAQLLIDLANEHSRKGSKP